MSSAPPDALAQGQRRASRSLLLIDASGSMRRSHRRRQFQGQDRGFPRAPAETLPL